MQYQSLKMRQSNINIRGALFMRLEVAGTVYGDSIADRFCIRPSKEDVSSFHLRRANETRREGRRT
jgi:hypothetical protein